MSREDLRREFWIFLYSQGYPSTVNDETLFLAAERVSYEAFKGKRLRHKNWSFINGGKHAEDVALTRLLAKSLGLKEGVDWDWELEPDDYHFGIAFFDGNRIRELLRLLELYNEASLVFLNASIKLASEESIEDTQRVFAEEWKKLREEKQRLFSETIQQLERVFKILTERMEKRLQ